MNLPHKDPILFAKKVLKQDKDSASVECIFPSLPTFGMGLEASAQASAALSPKQKEGFLAGANGVEMLKTMDKKNIIAKVKKIYSIDNMELFSFELEDYMRGKFAIYVK